MNKVDRLKKLKDQYHLQAKPTCRYGITFFKAYKRRNKYFRQFSTKQERSAYQIHCIEYKEFNLRLRSRRGNALPTDWDDLPTAIYDAEKSWKTSTRRSKQWYKINLI